jgi:hypothetical protein
LRSISAVVVAVVCREGEEEEAEAILNWSHSEKRTTSAAGRGNFDTVVRNDREARAGGVPWGVGIWQRVGTLKWQHSDSRPSLKIS